MVLQLQDVKFLISFYLYSLVFLGIVKDIKSVNSGNLILKIFEEKATVRWSFVGE